MLASTAIPIRVIHPSRLLTRSTIYHVGFSQPRVYPSAIRSRGFAVSISLGRKPGKRYPEQLLQSLQSRKSSMPETRSEGPLVWIDCEMTGLDSEKDTILSIACIVTDSDLNLMGDEGYHAVVQHQHAELERMNEWCRTTHKKSGLWYDTIISTTNAEAAAKGCLEYIEKCVPEKETALLAGSSVHFDKAFLLKEPWAPIIRHLHYRILDVSSIKEAARRWSPLEVVDGTPAKRLLHKAMPDILETIAEAKYYREMIFMAKQSSQTPEEGAPKPT